MVNGWHSSSARLALSARAGPKAEVELSTTAGSDASEPSALNRTCRTTKRSDETSTPGGGLQHWLKRARKASSSLCDNCAAWPFAAPSEGALLGVSAVATWRRGSRLSSSAAT